MKAIWYETALIFVCEPTTTDLLRLQRELFGLGRGPRDGVRRVDGRHDATVGPRRRRLQGSVIGHDKMTQSRQHHSLVSDGTMNDEERTSAGSHISDRTEALRSLVKRNPVVSCS